jgi:hypothetical protein
MNARRYCKIVLFVALLALVVIALFNLLVDPIGAYPGIGLKSFERFRATQFSRVARAELARRGDWEIAIFGTSRPKIGMPSAHPLFTNNHACNLSVDAARMSEAAVMFEYTRARNPLRRVLLCLDFAMFRGSTVFRFDLPESRFNPQLSLLDYHCKNLIGSGATDQSFWFTIDLWKMDFPPPEQRNGFAVRVPKADASQRALFAKTLRSLANGYALQQVATNEMQALRDVLVSARAHGIDLTLAINPVHALDLELMVAGKNWERFEQWKRDVAGLVAEVGATNVVLWDFAGCWEPTMEPVPPAGDTTTRMKFYYENSHYTPAMGALMLDRMFFGAANRFGATISTMNIEQHLQLLREQRELFARRYPDDVEWVARISQQARATMKKSAEPAGELE